VQRALIWKIECERAGAGAHKQCDSCGADRQRQRRRYEHGVYDGGDQRAVRLMGMLMIPSRGFRQAPRHVGARLPIELAPYATGVDLQRAEQA